MIPTQNPVAIALRWIAFIPGGIVGGILAGVAGLLFFGAGSWLAGYRFDAPLTLFMAGFWSGYASVAAGAWIAPSPSKTLPAVTVAVIGFLLGGTTIVIRIMNQEWFRSVEGLCVVVGVLVAMLQNTKKEGDGRFRQD